MVQKMSSKSEKKSKQVDYFGFIDGHKNHRNIISTHT
jgi:hypothetical protein